MALDLIAVYPESIELGKLSTTLSDRARVKVAYVDHNGFFQQDTVWVEGLAWEMMYTPLGTDWKSREEEKCLHLLCSSKKQCVLPCPVHVVRGVTRSYGRQRCGDRKPSHPSMGWKGETEPMPISPGSG